LPAAPLIPHNLGRKAKLDDVTPHAIRYTFASVAGDGVMETAILLGRSAP
jgi:hypothetical protein